MKTKNNEKNRKKSKRVGAAKKEMRGKGISLEQLNSIKVDNFD